MALAAPLMVSGYGPPGAGGHDGRGGHGPGFGGFGCGSDDDDCGFWDGGGCAVSIFFFPSLALDEENKLC